MKYCFIYLELEEGVGLRAVRSRWMSEKMRSKIFKSLKRRLEAGEISNLKHFAKRSKNG